MKWFDTHAHLQSEDYDADLAEVLARTEAAGVGRVLLPGSNWEDSVKGSEIALADERLLAAVGVHPHDAKTYSAEMGNNLKELVKSTNEKASAQGRRVVVAIGEIGLDYHYDYSPRDVQRRVFRWQLELAHELELPVIIHVREAFQDSIEILRQAREDGLLTQNPAGVIHCYSGSVESAEIFLDLGFYLGFDGPITFPKSRRSHDVIRKCPRDRIVIETDCPYLTPVPYRGKRNEPTYLPIIGAKVASLWEVSEEEAAQQLLANSMNLYGLS